jgi:DNA-binding NarL/FixJ family response regulator
MERVRGAYPTRNLPCCYTRREDSALRDLARLGYGRTVSECGGVRHSRCMNTTISKILIVHPERVLRDTLSETVRATFPRGAITAAADCKEAHAAQTSTFDLVVTDAVFSDGDILDLASRWNRCAGCCPPVLVVTRHKEPHLLECIQAAGVTGVFDSTTENTQTLKDALAAVARGEEYASATIAKRILRFAPSGPDVGLTPLERLVFAMIGDGSSDALAARRLKRSKLTIQTVRYSLHRKLGVRDRSELIHVAVRLGFICFTEHGIVRPGFKRLLDACPRHTRRSAQRHP